MLIGYARVSTDDQRLDLQLAALKAAGCDKMYQDHGATGSNMERPGLEAAIKALGPGDTLVVWRLDRLGRSLTDLVQFIDDLGAKGCEFKSLNESVDTSTSGGRLIFHIMAAFAEFERNLIRERTKAGLDAARQRGSRLGRPPKKLSPCQIESAFQHVYVQGQRLEDVAARHRVSSSTLRRRLRAAYGARTAKNHPKKYPPTRTATSQCLQTAREKATIPAQEKARQASTGPHSVAGTDTLACLIFPDFPGSRQCCHGAADPSAPHRLRAVFIHTHCKTRSSEENAIMCPNSRHTADGTPIQGASCSHPAARPAELCP
ncbi:recombinase family protein [Paracoccus sp. (in: a-proteobacteria)]|uniref:recombinase family protein n=1 Tax=Paracoccus sp. TaxID=267 RepID=UPI0028A5D1DC|nr:recombinase family protein [Paracoccus sp. (in: a-proteobacteria)]